jgi:hypothetical protein
MNGRIPMMMWRWKMQIDRYLGDVEITSDNVDVRFLGELSILWSTFNSLKTLGIVTI